MIKKGKGQNQKGKHKREVNSDADFYEDGEVLTAMEYNGEACERMVKSTLEDVEYVEQLNI